MSARICVVIGQCCSGKDTFANKLQRFQIDIGSIVRSIKSTNVRTYDQSLDTVIILQLKQLIDQHDNVVITGIRQLTILQFIINEYCNQYVLINLDVPNHILKQRFMDRQADKDALLTFEQVIEKDNELGFSQIQQFIQSNKKLFLTIQNY